MLSKYGNCMLLLNIKNKLKIGCFHKKSQEEFSIFCEIFNKTIIPHVLVGYEMITANRVLLAICHLISTAYSWNNIVIHTQYIYCITSSELSCTAVTVVMGYSP